MEPFCFEGDLERLLLPFLP